MGSTGDRLKGRLEQLSALSQDYWSFKDDSERDLTHSLFQYPAMMVPRLQRRLLAEIVESDPRVGSVFDPYIGSGTVMTEAMLRGLSVGGLDINPLAILLCQAKAGPFYSEQYTEAALEIRSAAQRDRSRRVETSFPSLRKWFNSRAIIELSRLRRAIAVNEDLPTRRFLWVALAETVRLTSNSRTSTVKLHLRDTDDLARRAGLSPISVFAAVAERNATSLRDQRQLLAERQLLVDDCYRYPLNIEIGDARLAPSSADRRFDLLVTSPPYGDNQTTVTYGQHSYLPLQWIDLADIADGLDGTCLQSTHEIDHRSLGGSTRHALARAKSAAARSENLQDILSVLAERQTDGAKRVAAFAADLDASLDPILCRLRRHALMVWVLGDRRVNGIRVPTGQILTELLGDRAELVSAIDRRIDHKRTAHRNSIAETMTDETVLVYRKRHN